MDLNSVDVVLVMALSLTLHGTAKAIREMAHRIKDKVCMERRAKMRALARTDSDQRVLQIALNIVQRATDAMGIHPNEPFPVKGARMLTVEPPRCHLKPMLLAGAADARHWACQHCTHTKPLEVPCGQSQHQD